MDDINQKRNQRRRQREKEEESNKRRKYLILLLLLLLLITICVTFWALFCRDTIIVLAPDYAPQQSEQNAEKIEGDDDEKLEQPEGGGAVSLIYSKEVTIDLSDNKAKLLFGNPSKSNQDMLIQIVIQDKVILQSGTLSPGFRVTKLDLFDNIKLSEGKYEGKFVIYYYQRDTGEKAMLNTEIPLTITVKK